MDEGSERRVYAHRIDPALVVKVSRKVSNAQNRTEWCVWNKVKNEPGLVSIFGTCFEISASGKFLVMEKLDDLTTKAMKQAMCYPGWLMDMKETSFGISSTGEVKIRDYGMATLGQSLEATTIYKRFSDEELDGWISQIDCR